MRILKGIWRAAACLLLATPAWAADLTVVQVADYSGSRASLGLALRYGARLAIEDANRNGGVKGRSVRFVALDDRYTPTETVRLLRESVISEAPLAIVNILGTGTTGAVLADGVLTEAGIALIGPYTGADALREPVNPQVFHVRVSYGEEVDRIAAHFASIGAKRVGLLRESGAFGDAISAAFDAAAANHGLEIVARGVTPEGSDDVAAGVATVAAAQPEGVLLGTAGQPTSRLVKATHEAGILAARMMLSVNDLDQIREFAGSKASRGVGKVAVMPDPQACTLPLCRELEQLHAAHGDPSQSLTPNTVEGYISARAFLTALARVSGEPTREKLRSALETAGQMDFGGFTLTYSPTRHNGSTFMDVGVLGSGGRIMY
ncbi:MAG: ABC transporter substrate-binding protein [Rhodocyclaceae bacterium]|nr:ABC transporter substrate-binding protein [Rhodocyclaceae bacterium]